jgi:hypothetical protein
MAKRIWEPSPSVPVACSIGGAAWLEEWWLAWRTAIALFYISNTDG